MERFVHGDVVYERGEYDETMEKGADGKWRIDRLNAGPRSLAPPAM